MPVVDMVTKVNLNVIGKIEGAAQFGTREFGQRMKEKIVKRLEGGIDAPL
jgi:hypothetical protein